MYNLLYKINEMGYSSQKKIDFDVAKKSQIMTLVNIGTSNVIFISGTYYW